MLAVAWWDILVSERSWRCLTSCRKWRRVSACSFGEATVCRTKAETKRGTCYDPKLQVVLLLRGCRYRDRVMLPWWWYGQRQPTGPQLDLTSVCVCVFVCVWLCYIIRLFSFHFYKQAGKSNHLRIYLISNIIVIIMSLHVQLYKNKKIIPVIFTCSDYTERITKQRCCSVRVSFAYEFEVGRMRVKVTVMKPWNADVMFDTEMSHQVCRPGACITKSSAVHRQLKWFGSCFNHCNLTLTRIRTLLESSRNKTKSRDDEKISEIVW